MSRYVTFKKQANYLYINGGEFDGYRLYFNRYTWNNNWILQRKVWLFGWVDCHEAVNLYSNGQIKCYDSIRDAIFDLGIDYKDY